MLWVVASRTLTVTEGGPADDAVSGHVSFGGGEVNLQEGAVVTVRLLDITLAARPCLSLLHYAVSLTAQSRRQAQTLSSASLVLCRMQE